MDKNDTSKWESISRFICIVYAFMFVFDGIMSFLTEGNISNFYIGTILCSAFLSSIILFKHSPINGYTFMCSITLVLGYGFWHHYASSFVFYPMGLMFVISITTFSICALTCMKTNQDKNNLAL